MTQKTEVLLSVASQTGATNGGWFATRRDGRETFPIQISLQAGTATWEIQGRNSPTDDAVVIATASADQIVQVPRVAQVRVALTAATGATLRATADRPLRPVA